MIWKLALQNIRGAGLRTWLNVIVLSFSFVVIVWHRGLLDGWDQQARRDTINWEIGGGQIWHRNYDPYDPFMLAESYGPETGPLREALDRDELTPILIWQAAVYPRGRMSNALLKGILPSQNILDLPTRELVISGHSTQTVPVMMGTRMARQLKVEVGDSFAVRWRDVNSTFDATTLEVVHIFNTHVPSVDLGQIWCNLSQLRTMLNAQDASTMWVCAKGINLNVQGEWNYRGHSELLASYNQLIEQKQTGGYVLYILMLGLALLALFDTQVLSVFRRQREIGTLMALGMTRWQVIRLFTLEGTLTAVLAGCLAAVYGIPLLGWMAVSGIPMPEMSDAYGMAVAESIYPVYNLGLITVSSGAILLASTVVSYLPAHKITRLKPTEAIRGKLQ